MKILITGNMGYVGPVVVRHLRTQFPNSFLHGHDTAYFAHCLTGSMQWPERRLDLQTYGDIRQIDKLPLDGYDAIIHLAAISNDPMGNRFAGVTTAINYEASVDLAKAAADAGVRNFVFASSCSVYGVAAGPPRREEDPLNPATAYAASKIATEQGLAAIGGNMVITSLRFATACGMSDRLRLDLVLNDFVACALTSGRITVLSDGTPWRPLIDVSDMARAIEWAATRTAEDGGRTLTVNAGADACNYQVADLADAVASALPGTIVDINKAAPADSRSYRVDFGRYASLAPDHQPRMTLADSIRELSLGLHAMQFTDPDFRNSPFMRLNVLQGHIGQQRLSEDLIWRASVP